ncbi:MAG: hypothetical protein L3K18_07675 [Thermoplasmata archaeon]|nr:hypothetical protein [Thermoplasmata archaeon]
MPSNPLDPWKDQFTFVRSAEREFLLMPTPVQQAFVHVFPEFGRHPWSASATLDVLPLREMPGRWRLKVAGGHRGIYRSHQGRPDFEMFQSRTEVYNQLRRLLSSRP